MTSFPLANDKQLKQKVSCSTIIFGNRHKLNLGPRYNKEEQYTFIHAFSRIYIVFHSVFKSIDIFHAFNTIQIYYDIKHTRFQAMFNTDSGFMTQGDYFNTSSCNVEHVLGLFYDRWD